MDDPRRSRSARRIPPSSRLAPYSLPPASPPTILLTVAGLTPQVITETLYCLLVQRNPPADVREVHVLTTTAGEEEVRRQLLHQRDGWFRRFRRDYGIPARHIRFDQSCIHVPRGPDGKPLDDVRTPEDNARVADALLAIVRDLTRDPAVALHASVAGGRKTMGLFLGIAFQLFARPQDRLSHVLVAPAELEGFSDFFYPPPTPRTYAVKGKRILSRDARVGLAEIPIPLLRGKVQNIGLENLSYSLLVSGIQRDLDRQEAPPHLTMHSHMRALVVADSRISLTPLEFAIYRLFADRRLKCGTPACGGCRSCGLEATEFDKPYVLEPLKDSLVALRARDERTRDLASWRDAPHRRFREVRARINGKISNALGRKQWAARYAIAASGKRPDTLYYLPLAPGLIRLQ